MNSDRERGCEFCLTDREWGQRDTIKRAATVLGDNASRVISPSEPDEVEQDRHSTYIERVQQALMAVYPLRLVDGTCPAFDSGSPEAMLQVIIGDAHQRGQREERERAAKRCDNEAERLARLGAPERARVARDLAAAIRRGDTGP